MELILNELSFDGQFQSQEKFVEYALEVLIPVLDVVIENRIPLLKKSDIYTYKITYDLALQDFLLKANDPVISVLKTYIVNLGYCEPYWDLNALTNPKINYEYPISSDEPNCFTEAIERKGGLLSLQQSCYDTEQYFCKRNEEEVTISNVTEMKQLLKDILIEDNEKICYIIENYPYKRSVVCVNVNGKCFAEEALLENGLETGDLLHIVESISYLIEDFEQGRRSNLWDKLQEDIFELRLHISANRIFRLLFVQFDGIQLLNGFVKKTQKTPAAEIHKAIEIRKQFLNIVQP